MVQDFEKLVDNDSDSEFHTGRDVTKIKVCKYVITIFVSVIVVITLAAGFLMVLHVKNNRSRGSLCDVSTKEEGELYPEPSEQDHHRIKILPQNCGQRTNQSEFPWMAEIYFKHERDWEHAAIVGTLISSRYVLTPAYRFVNYYDFKGTAKVRVLFGEPNAMSYVNDDYFKNRTYREVIREESLIPEQFRTDRKMHNLALLSLDRDVVYNDHIQPICLPAIHKRSDGVWSQPFDILLDIGVLQKYAVKVVQYSKCSDGWNHAGFVNEPDFNDSHACVQLTYSGKPCRGLEGSPLMAAVDVNGVQRVVEYGLKYVGDCTDRLQIYTNVSYHMEWILDHMRP